MDFAFSSFLGISGYSQLRVIAGLLLAATVEQIYGALTLQLLAFSSPHRNVIYELKKKTRLWFSAAAAVPLAPGLGSTVATKTQPRHGMVGWPACKAGGESRRLNVKMSILLHIYFVQLCVFFSILDFTLKQFSLQLKGNLLFILGKDQEIKNMDVRRVRK